MVRPLSVSLLAALCVSAHAQLVLPWHGDDGSGYISSFQVRKTGPTGRANTLYITDSSNTSDVLLGNTVGLGRAAYFTITNPANAQMALRGDTNGSGMGVFGLSTGTGKGGSFRIINPANTNAALHGQTNGSGPALRLQAGTGLGADIEGGGLRVTAASALSIIGGSTFTGNSNFSGGFTSVGSRTTKLTDAEIFGLGSSTTSGFAGMYVTTAAGGKPFYGLDNVTNRFYFYLNAVGDLTFYHGSRDWLTAAQDGTTLFTAQGSGDALGVTQSGSGSAFVAANTNLSSTAPVGKFTSIGLGNGIRVIASNVGSGARGIDVSHAGVGPGVYSSSAGGNGIWGVTGTISGAGVLGDNTFGEAVVGRVFQTAGNSSNGIGAVVGRMDGLNGFGVRGFVTKNDSVGVMGQTGVSGSLGGFGVRGEVINPQGTGIGVYGKATGAGHIAAVYAEGKTVATGTKSFLIDHPVDPENKMLYHYSMESDEPLNAYSGNVITDSSGRAWVNLPAYVEQINKDFRYQLTVIGSFARAIIGREIREGQFEIRTDEPNVKVSWRVEGVRNDRFVKKYGAPVEVDKPANWKGKYLSPELYDREPSRGIFYTAPASVPLLSEVGITHTQTQQVKQKR